jgi:hypothetical protein
MLISPTLQTDLAHLRDTLDAAHLFAAGAAKLNAQAARILAMDDAALTTWLQTRVANGTLDTLLTRHATTGAAANAALDATCATLAESGEKDIPTTRVDIRSIPEKLAAQRRTIDMDTLTVTTLPPEPETPGNAEPQLGL